MARFNQTYGRMRADEARAARQKNFHSKLRRRSLSQCATAKSIASIVVGLRNYSGSKYTEEMPASCKTAAVGPFCVGVGVPASFARPIK